MPGLQSGQLSSIVFKLLLDLRAVSHPRRMAGAYWDAGPTGAVRWLSRGAVFIGTTEQS